MHAADTKACLISRALLYYTMRSLCLRSATGELQLRNCIQFSMPVRWLYYA